MPKVDVSVWTAIQSNGAKAVFSLAQHEQGRLTGSATHSDGRVRSTELTGMVDEQARTFRARVVWNDNTTGIYTANFEPDGRLVGFGFDEQHPESQATWISDRLFP